MENALTPSTSSQGSELEVISEIALRRRREAQALLEQKQPTYVIEVVQSEVRIVFKLPALPYKYANFEKLNQALNTHYGLNFEKPSLDQLISMIGLDPRKLDDNQIGSYLMSLDSPMLRFEGGRFPARNDFIPIRSLQFGFEHIMVVVEGVSTIADLVAQEAMEFLWSTTNANKRWDDIKPLIITMQYATATKINLGFPPENLLSKSFLKFIDDDIISGKAFANQMGSQSARHGFKPPNSIIATYTFNELELRFHRFNKETGVSSESILNFSVPIRDDARSGIVVVKSNLSYDKHIELLDDLRQALVKSE